MRRPFGIAMSVAGIGAALTFGTAGRADHPECETWNAIQPQPGAPDVRLLYTWDATCGADPDLGPLKFDGDEIDVTWDHDTAVAPHEHEAWDIGVPTGVHTYKLTVTPEGEDPYVLTDSLLVSGTASTDTDPDTDDGDTDTGADADAGTDTGDTQKIGGEDSSGCSASPRGPSRGLAALVVAIFGQP